MLAMTDPGARLGRYGNTIQYCFKMLNLHWMFVVDSDFCILQFCSRAERVGTTTEGRSTMAIDIFENDVTTVVAGSFNRVVFW